MSRTKGLAGPVLIMAGGTGGHVFPAVAVAQELLDSGIAVVWMGTRAGLEARIVPQLGLPIEWVRIRGLRGKSVLRLVAAPFMLLFALWQAFLILLRVRPCVVLGMGGYLSGPGGLVAWMMGYPLLIHEQNSVAGFTNRWLSIVATCSMEAFANTLPAKRNSVHTGNPVRSSIQNLPIPERRLARRAGPIRLFVLGGSLGAQVLNETVPAALALIACEQRPEVWHQAGKATVELAQRRYHEANVEGRVTAFIEDMDTAYGWADLVICRAGAMTVAELAAVGVASLLVPYAHAVDDHQTINGKCLVDAGAAILIPQAELNPENLAQLLTEFGNTRERLLAMACNARRIAKPHAARHIADICMQIAGNNLQKERRGSAQ